MSAKPVPIGEREAAIGAAFRAARKRRGFTLLQLSAALGCSINSVRWHEAGARLLRTGDLIRAAEAMGVPTTEVLPPELTPESAS